MVRKVLGWGAFIVATLVVALVALGACNSDAPANLPETVTTKTPPTSAPPTTTAPPSTDPVASSLKGDPTFTRLAMDNAWSTYSPAQRTDVCDSLDLLGPDVTAQIFAGQDDADLLDPDVAVDELDQLCNDA